MITSEKSCKRKVTYFNRKDVKKALKTIRRTAKFRRGNLHYYICNVCQNYHIGNKKVKK